MGEFEWKKLSPLMRRRYAVITAIAYQKLDLSQLSATTGIPKPTLARLMKSLRVEFGMDISYVKRVVSKPKTSKGYYKIERWGVLDQVFFKANIAKYAPNHNSRPT